MEYGLVRCRDQWSLGSSLVLILVLMEYGLVLTDDRVYLYRLEGVLILVLMEYGLVHEEAHDEATHTQDSLNPCFNGIWSRTLLYSPMRCAQ